MILSYLTGSLISSTIFPISKNGNQKWNIFNVSRYFHHRRQKYIMKVVAIQIKKKSITFLLDIILICLILTLWAKLQKNNSFITTNLSHPQSPKICFQFLSLWDKFLTFCGSFTKNKTKSI